MIAGRSAGAAPPSPADCPLRFTDVTDESGIDFVHNHGGCGRRYTVEFMVAGLATFDYNNDGWIDIYFLNGAPLKGTETDRAPTNALYRNNGDWTFTDVTHEAGVGDTGFGLGVAAADYDNDGDQDLYINNFGPNVLYRNNGDGTFTDVTGPAGVDGGNQFGAGTCFLDMDADGDLDLYVANYLDFTYERHAEVVVGAYPYPPGPKDFPPVPDLLYRNNGDGTFTDVSQSSGIGAFAGTSMGMICFDYEEDGDTDVFVGNDAMANFLFRNDGRGRFEEVALLAGVACNDHGSENGSMGVDCGDYDNDGLLDLFMTDYAGEIPVLYRNLGKGLFYDAATSAQAGTTAFNDTTWGTALVDFDNDGQRDIFMACGHFLEDIHEIDDRTAYRMPNRLLMNLGNGRFSDVSRRCGDGLQVVACSKGAACDDLDNDGDIDIVVLNTGSRPTVLRNDSSTENHWLQIRLQGEQSNRDGVGARVSVTAGDLVQTAEVHSGRGYQSHFGTRLHFGLGSRRQVDRVEVRWIGRGHEVFPASPADRLIGIVEKQGKPVRP